MILNTSVDLCAKNGTTQNISCNRKMRFTMKEKKKPSRYQQYDCSKLLTACRLKQKMKANIKGKKHKKGQKEKDKSKEVITVKQGIPVFFEKRNSFVPSPSFVSSRK
ncbi:hypothetical protein CEXT_749311 [Caerostris extrusa]|uniref:Uncharacterized protein n=1 Tax=Caerostris extrusa TaxID=172846 RepID=A0AAV4Y4Y5_CAEEX|nr:hypothetical protein CEXT_749311 [Caerostris extrusa]